MSLHYCWGNVNIARVTKRIILYVELIDWCAVINWMVSIKNSCDNFKQAVVMRLICVFIVCHRLIEVSQCHNAAFMIIIPRLCYIVTPLTVFYVCGCAF